MFSLKLTQISSQNFSGSDSNCQTKKEKKPSPQKYSQGNTDLLDLVTGIDCFIQAQRVALIETISQETGKESQESQIQKDLNSFLDDLQTKMASLTRQIKSQASKKSSPVKSPGKKKSPIKSPSKQDKKENDDYGSPQGKNC